MQADSSFAATSCDVTAAEEGRDRTLVGARIDIVSDAICPWCYIGKRHLERALAALSEDELTFQVHWNPFQLNPDMPREGRDRSAYRAWKFGSAARAANLDQRITEAAANAGLAFRMDLITHVPNTIDVHRLIWFAGQQGNQDAAMEAVFRTYFIDGGEIGNRGVLADCGVEAGLPRESLVEFLAGEVAEKEIRLADEAAREAGISGVPSFFLDGYSLFSGAMPPDAIVNALRRGREVLRTRPTVA